MLEPITGLPEGVIGFEAVGEIHADDYRDTLIPALEASTGRDRATCRRKAPTIVYQVFLLDETLGAARLLGKASAGGQARRGDRMQIVAGA